MTLQRNQFELRLACFWQHLNWNPKWKTIRITICMTSFLMITHALIYDLQSKRQNLLMCTHRFENFLDIIEFAWCLQWYFSKWLTIDLDYQLLMARCENGVFFTMDPLKRHALHFEICAHSHRNHTKHFTELKHHIYFKTRYQNIVCWFLHFQHRNIHLHMQFQELHDFNSFEFRCRKFV